jgi:hypothetical protein
MINQSGSIFLLRCETKNVVKKEACKPLARWRLQRAPRRQWSVGPQERGLR